MTRDDDGFDDVARLLRAAGSRPAVSEERAAMVYRAVHARWRGHVRARRRRQFLLGAAAVVVTGLSVAAGTNLGRRLEVVQALQTGPAVALVERSKGGGLWTPAPGGTRSFLPEGSAVVAGTWLETAPDGLVALRLDAATSLRLDAGTRARVLSASAVFLERGGLYVDNPEGRGSAHLEIRTVHGLARDVGTQFEVRATATETRIRVREGLVVLARDGVQHEVGRGSELRVPEGGVLARRAIVPFGAEWAWVEEAAPEFRLEGQSLQSFLRWVERETGWTIQLSPEAQAHMAAGVTLHGSIDDLAPSEALSVVLATCALTHRQQEGTVWIEPVSGEGRDR